MSVVNSLAEMRTRRGLSVAALASSCGVTRQTIYAIEAGTFVPNTAVALRLSTLLDVSVEDLFCLAEEEEAPVRVTLLPGEHEAVAGQPLRLCRVGTKLVGFATEDCGHFLPESNGVYLGSDQAAVIGESPSAGIVAAGCDPALAVLARHAARAGIRMLAVHRNSSEALALLRQGRVHMAGTHLPVDSITLEAGLKMIPFASWEQGLVAGSPRTKSLEHLVEMGLCFANREAGSGTRALLDRTLKHLGIPKSRLQGYDRVAHSHLAAAAQVKAGLADGCLATRSAALHYGLPFAPIASEQYNLVVHRRSLREPEIQKIFHLMTERRFRREAETVGAYKLLQ